MQTINAGYRGVALIFNLNLDRLLYVGAIAMALGLAPALSMLLK